MDVPDQVRPSLVGQQASRILSVMFSCNHCFFTSLTSWIKQIYLRSFQQAKECLIDVQAWSSPSLVRWVVLPPILPVRFSGKKCEHNTLFFSLTINVILFPFTAWIKQISLILLAGQSGCDGYGQPRLAHAWSDQPPFPYAHSHVFRHRK